jgi:hypothetical protein
MTATTLKILIAIFMIAHGWVHYSLTTVPISQPGALHTPYWPSWWRTHVDATWPASRLGLPPAVVRTFGWLLWLIVVAAYMAAGLGLVGLPGLNSIWQGAAVTGSVASLILLGFYWHPWLVAGVVIDLALLVALRTWWPQTLFSA